MRKRQLAAALLLLCLFAQGLAHARSASIVFDEGPHLAVGYSTLRTGDLRLQPVHIHPPLANMLAAAPLLLQTDLPDPRSVEGWEIASLSAVTDTVIWQYPYPRRLAMAARLPILLMTLILGAVVFRWASDLFGPRAGLFALGLCAFDPNVIAHGSLVTTDMAVVLWGTLALFLTARYLRSPHWGYGAGAGVAVGLALASKVSALLLVPAVGALWLLGPRSFSWRRRFLATAGVLFLAFLVLWAAYGFEVRRLPGFPLPVPAATHVEIYRSLQEHYRLGHPSFLMGQNSDRGWLAYFPVAFALKTPLVTLLLLVASVVLMRRASRRSLLAPRQWGPLLLFPLLHAASTLFSSVNIGYRHLLPLLPFIFVFVSWLGRESRLQSRRLLWRSLVGLAVAGWYVLEAILLFPHYLAYFNLLSGGPVVGYRYLVDSNLDWGQNLWQLNDWMWESGVERIRYAHFSPAWPQVYGVEAGFLPPDPRAEPFAPLAPAPGVYAIGATVLQGVYTPDVNTYAWFRSREPVARLGHALFVYEVSPRTEITWVALCADPAPALSPEAARSGFGQPDLRVVLLDCGQSWILAAGGETGAYVLPAHAEPPPNVTLEMSTRHPDGSPFYSVYRLNEGLAAVHRLGGVTVEGPLTFVGYQVDPASVHAGEMVEFRAFWEVKEVPVRPLSLMAHLVGPEGVPVAVGDGLGILIEQWQPGDVFVQRHFLQVPDGTAEGEYELQTGAYWLETMERWPVWYEGGGLGDRIVLTVVTVEDEGGSSDHR